jgi:hypothetical protein
MKNIVTIYPFYRDETLYSNTKSKWDYAKILKNFQTSVSSFKNVKFIINTCEHTTFPDNENFLCRRFNSRDMSLMTAIVESEADIVRKSFGKNIIFCGSDEMFIQNPSNLFDKYDFDILIGYDGVSRIMNGIVCVRSNAETIEFFDNRVREFHKLSSELKNWGGDMHSYGQAFARESRLFSTLNLLSFPSRASGKTNVVQSLAYVLAKRLKILDNIGNVGRLKVKFFYWGNEIAKSVNATDEDLIKQARIASNKGFHLLDFKGNRKSLIGDNSDTVHRFE